jgi:hypothetical protein
MRLMAHDVTGLIFDAGHDVAWSKGRKSSRPVTDASCARGAAFLGWEVT